MFKIVTSDTQTYRQSGNSIVVDVLMFLLLQIIQTNVYKQDKYEQLTLL